MYTRLNQVGGSIGSEEAIGGSILIPNAMLFSQVAINYTPKQLAPYFLDEVVIRLTFDSDWDIAEKILLDAARKVTGDIIRQTGKEPYIRSDIYDYGVYMRLRYMTPAWERPRMAHEILKEIFREFQRNPRVDFAIPYVYSYRKSMESGAHTVTGPEAVTEVAMESIDDPEANVPLRPADPNYIAELADRIKQMGLLQPVLVQRAAERPVHARRGAVPAAGLRAAGLEGDPRDHQGSRCRIAGGADAKSEVIGRPPERLRRPGVTANRAH